MPLEFRCVQLGAAGFFVGLCFALCLWGLRALEGGEGVYDDGARLLLFGMGSTFGCRVWWVCMLGEEWCGC